MILDQAVLLVKLKPGAWVEPSRMMKAIHDSGFTPVEREVVLTVSGTLEKRSDTYILVMDGMKEPRSLICVPPQEGDSGQSDLSSHVGGKVLITGQWVGEAGGRIVVQRIEAPQAP